MRCGRAGFGAGALRAALDARSLWARSATRPCGPQTRLAFRPHRPARLGPAQAPAHPQRTPGALGARQVSRQLHLKRACVLVAQARADVQVERSCSGKEPALNSVDGGLALPAPSPTLLLLLHAQEQPHAQLGAVRIGCEPGAAFLLRDNYLAKPARFSPDTSARRRGSRGEASTHVTCRPPACAGVGDGLDSRLRGNDGMYVIPAQAHWCPE